ncbi:DUF4411 family protein [Nannocystis pusilla]|uniref:DUF4411 family protein n=1 Tax=Nannocystis pusilla TaxID=889268 RepID=UPI003B831B92
MQLRNTPHCSSESQVQNQFTQGAKEEFARVADGWLLAKAQASGFTVVTEEVYSQDVKRRVLIPNVCRDLRLHYINTFSMLRTLDTAFVLKR